MDAQHFRADTAVNIQLTRIRVDAKSGPDLLDANNNAAGLATTSSHRCYLGVTDNVRNSEALMPKGTLGWVGLRVVIP